MNGSLLAALLTGANLLPCCSQCVLLWVQTPPLAMKLSKYTRLTLTVLGLVLVEILLLAGTQLVNTDIKLVLGFCAGFLLIPTSQFVHLWLASGVSE
jgi:hypothetical protein